jgi:hypothetical protein
MVNLLQNNLNSGLMIFFLILVLLTFSSELNFGELIPSLYSDIPLCGQKIHLYPPERKIYSTSCLKRNTSYTIRPSAPAGV